MKETLPKEFLEISKSVKGKRARVVIDYILKYGIITTEDLEKYGYKYPPKAARDVREQGIPLKTVYVKSSEGKRIAGYILGDVSEIKQGRIGGRVIIPKTLKKKLIKLSGSKCFICSLKLEETVLQVDHRIPYEVTGETRHDTWNSKDYMLLCGSRQRAKSWSCEHCDNWITRQDKSICNGCYWAHPESYTHIALSEVRRLDITWKGEEINEYEMIKKYADNNGIAVSEYVKEILHKNMKDA